jgi:hypothetical protein
MSTTIDLGKLRFNWVGVWVSNTLYEYNDLVRHGGDVFVYIYGLKTSGNVTTNVTYWAKVQEGLSWQGEYDASNAYKPHEVVHHSNNAYVNILEEPAAGNAPPNATYWQLLATGIKFEGAYNNATVYQKDDIVYYGANTYICIVNSAGGNLPTDTAFWSTFSHGLDWKGIYTNASAYKKSDVVSYGASVYIAKLDTTGNLPTDATKWDPLTSGIKYTSAWNNSKADYRISDVATFGGSAFIAIADNPTVGSDPVSNSAQWDALASGVQWEGVYNAATVYQKDDIVSYGSGTYIANVNPTTGVNPVTNSAHWDVLTTGLKYLAAWNTATANYRIDDVVTFGGSAYIAVADNPTAGSDPVTNASQWDALATGIRSMGDWSASTAYLIDDVVSYGGQTFKAIVAHSSSVFATELASNNWVRFTAGLDWKGIWLTATAYKVNDIVNSGGSVYVASADHTSTSFSGDSAYWQSFANAGTDVGLTITSHGDLVYRDSTGPAALNAGTAGQYLTTGGANADPSWTTLTIQKGLYYYDFHTGNTITSNFTQPNKQVGVFTKQLEVSGASTVAHVSRDAVLMITDFATTTQPARLDEYVLADTTISAPTIAFGENLDMGPDVVMTIASGQELLVGIPQRLVI